MPGRLAIIPQAALQQPGIYLARLFAVRLILSAIIGKNYGKLK